MADATKLMSGASGGQRVAISGGAVAPISQAARHRCTSTPDQRAAERKWRPHTFGHASGYARHLVQRYTFTTAAAAPTAEEVVQKTEDAEVAKFKWWQRKIEDDTATQPPPALTRPSPGKYLRSKGVAAPGLLAASLLDSALLAFASEEERAARQAISNPKWTARRKYDAFRELLFSSPVLQEAKFEPLRMLLEACPSYGPGKYEFIRALLSGMTTAAEDDQKWNLIHEALERGRTEAAASGDEEEVEKHEVVQGLVHQMLLHADWQLEMLEDWGSASYDPVAWVFENAWHGQVKHKWDPLVAAFGMKAPTSRPEWDPIQAAFAAQPPAGYGPDPVRDLLKLEGPQPSSSPRFDPVGGLLKLKGPQPSDSPKFDPISGLLKLRAPAPSSSPRFDPVGGLLKLKGPDPSNSPKLDPVSGLLAAQPPRNQDDPVQDILQGLLEADVDSKEAVADPAGSILRSLGPQEIGSVPGKAARAVGRVIQAGLGGLIRQVDPRAKEWPSSNLSAVGGYQQIQEKPRTAASTPTPNLARPSTVRQPQPQASGAAISTEASSSHVQPAPQQPAVTEKVAARQSQEASLEDDPKALAAVRELCKSAEAIRRQREGTHQQVAASEPKAPAGDIVQDFVRPERAGASPDAAGSDLLAVLFNRNTSHDMEAVESAFREMVEDFRMTGQISLLSQLVESEHAHGRTLQALLHNIEGRAKYRALHRVLTGEHTASAVTTVQALYRITSPSV